MTQIELTDANLREAVGLAVEAARRGDLMLFPTDTVYGLGGLAFSGRVLEKLRKVKPERAEKPTAVLIDGMIRMSQCAGEVPSPRIVALAEAFWPGPLTMIWKVSNAIPPEFHPPDHSLGYRVPGHPFLLEVLLELESPLWATSANLPGQRPPKMYKEVSREVLDACDVTFRTAKLLAGKASTVVDVRGREPVVVRESAISEEEIKRIWKRA